MEKSFRAQIWAKRAKIGPKLVGFFCRFPKSGSLFFLQITYDDSLEQCLTTSFGEKKNGGLNLGPMDLNDVQNEFFSLFS